MFTGNRLNSFDRETCSKIKNLLIGVSKTRHTDSIAILCYPSIFHHLLPSRNSTLCAAIIAWIQKTELYCFVYEGPILPIATAISISGERKL